MDVEFHSPRHSPQQGQRFRQDRRLVMKQLPALDRIIEPNNNLLDNNNIDNKDDLDKNNNKDNHDTMQPKCMNINFKCMDTNGCHVFSKRETYDIPTTRSSQSNNLKM